MRLRLIALACIPLLVAVPVAHAAEDASARADEAELRELVGPVALYPDDLLAIVLPAATRPVQVAQAARYLQARKTQPALEPDPDWDPSVVALLNYPEVLAQLAADPAWTTELGVAVADSEEAVLAAVARFRQQARHVGNLDSDRHQIVETSGPAITIRPADPAVLYVPDYQPAAVLVHQPGFVYRYYARPFPVYYYPYPLGHALTRNDFWGVGRMYRIAWQDRHLQLLMQQHRAYPYGAGPYLRPYGFHRLYRYPESGSPMEHWWTYPSSATTYHSAHDRADGSRVLRTRPLPEGLAPRGERIELHRGARTSYPGQPAAGRQLPRR